MFKKDKLRYKLGRIEIVAIMLGIALLVLLEYAVYHMNIAAPEACVYCISTMLVVMCAALFGPYAGCIIGVVGCVYAGFVSGRGMVSEYVSAMAGIGIIVGLFAEKLCIRDGGFTRKNIITFTAVHSFATLFSWNFLGSFVEFMLHRSNLYEVLNRTFNYSIACVILTILIITPILLGVSRVKMKFYENVASFKLR